MQRAFCGVSRLVLGVMWLGSIKAFAASLTLCGIVDGGPADPDRQADGHIAATCNFAGGSFTGTVTEATSASSLTYWLRIGGDFYGSAVQNEFVTGLFSLNGQGDVYPYISQWPGGVLASSSPSATSTGVEFLAISAIALNLATTTGSAGAQTAPIRSGDPLPVPIGPDLPRLLSYGEFSGPGTLILSLRYETGGSDRYFSFPNGQIVVQASTEPGHVIPEPSTVFLLGFGVASLLAARRLGQP